MSTSNLLNRFRKLNKGKDWKEQIKPFNFFLVGFRFSEKEGKPVKPLAPFTKEYQSVVYRPFIDYEAGEIREGLIFWKPLSHTISDYINHPEYKFEGDIGHLERKQIIADDIVYIGKEANSIENQPLEVMSAQEFLNKKQIMQKILEMRQKDVEACGVDRKTFQRIKQRIRENGGLNLKTPAVFRLIKLMSEN